MAARLIAPTNLRMLVIVSALAFGCGAALGCSSPETKHACDVVTEVEIAKVFGGTVSERKREANHTISQCDYEVSADGVRPQGFVTVRIVFADAKAAYDSLQKPGSGYTPIPEISNAAGNEALRIIEVLSGDVLVGVQAIFVETELEPVPPQFHEVQSELLKLAKLAVRRLTR